MGISYDDSKLLSLVCNGGFLLNDREEENIEVGETSEAELIEVLKDSAGRSSKSLPTELRVLLHDLVMSSRIYLKLKSGPPLQLMLHL